MDASIYAIGAVLSQVQDGKERVVMYGSKGLVESQEKWCTTHMGNSILCDNPICILLARKRIHLTN